MQPQARIQAFFDEPTSTVTYLVWDPATRQAAVIDPVLDYDHRSGKASTASADRVLDAARADDLTIAWVLETHAHADHLSAAPYIRQRTNARVAIGEHIRDVQTIFRPVFNLDDVSGDGSEFDRLLKDGETLQIGQLTVEVLHTPGHTPACVSYRIGDAVFVGDTLFMPDYGTARCDFPGGDARTLFRSINKVLSLPPETQLYMCHDYQPGGREVQYVSTVADERARNVHVRNGISEEAFVAMRTARDATLGMPTLILPSVQVNMRAGQLPEPESNGTRYIKIPLNAV